MKRMLSLRLYLYLLNELNEIEVISAEYDKRHHRRSRYGFEFQASRGPITTLIRFGTVNGVVSTTAAPSPSIKAVESFALNPAVSPMTEL